MGRRLALQFGLTLHVSPILRNVLHARVTLSSSSQHLIPHRQPIKPFSKWLFRLGSRDQTCRFGEDARPLVLLGGSLRIVKTVGRELESG